MYFIIVEENDVLNKYPEDSTINLKKKKLDKNSYHFVRAEDIEKTYHKGSVLKQILIPKNTKTKEEEECVYRQPNFKSIITSKIILGKSYSLFDLGTYSIFNLDISSNQHIVDHASKVGNTNFLDMCIKKDFGLNVTGSSINNASANGHVNVLDWWLNYVVDLSVFEFSNIFTYTDFAIDNASKNGHVHVLEWWKRASEKYQLKLRYTQFAINWASRHGHTSVLDWWKQSDLELKYTDWAIDSASMEGHVRVLDWWKKSGLELKYSIDAINFACKNGHIEILNWWLHNSKKIIQPEFFITKKKYVYSSIKDDLPIRCVEETVKCWLELKYSNAAMLYASTDGHINVLDWWMQSGLKLKYNKDLLQDVSFETYPNVFDWWQKSGLDVLIEEYKDIKKYDKRKMRQWWDWHMGGYDYPESLNEEWDLEMDKKINSNKTITNC